MKAYEPRGTMTRNSYLRGTSLHKMMQVYGTIIRTNPRAWLHGLPLSAEDRAAYPDLFLSCGALRGAAPVMQVIDAHTGTSSTDTVQNARHRKDAA